MNNFEELDVSWGSPNDFWEKSEAERYKYFKNASIHYFALLSELEDDKKWERKARWAKDIFTNIMFFLVFLMTTKEEQLNDIAISWIERFKAEIAEKPELFLDYNKQGIA